MKVCSLRIKFGLKLEAATYLIYLHVDRITRTVQSFYALSFSDTPYQWSLIIFFLLFSLVPISAFAIYGAYPTYSSTGVAVFSSVKLNIGGHYSTTTGKYICHFPGIYVFSLNLYKKSGASTIYCDIRKNGSGVAHASVPSQSSGYYESSASTVLRLARGDTVDVGSCGNPSNIDNYTSFIGFLLKAD